MLYHDVTIVRGIDPFKLKKSGSVVGKQQVQAITQAVLLVKYESGKIKWVGFFSSRFSFLFSSLISRSDTFNCGILSLSAGSLGEAYHFLARNKLLSLSIALWFPHFLMSSWLCCLSYLRLQLPCQSRFQRSSKSQSYHILWLHHRRLCQIREFGEISLVMRRVISRDWAHIWAE